MNWASSKSNASKSALPPKESPLLNPKPPLLKLFRGRGVPRRHCNQIGHIGVLESPPTELPPQFYQSISIAHLPPFVVESPCLLLVSNLRPQNRILFWYRINPSTLKMGQYLPLSTCPYNTRIQHSLPGLLCPLHLLLNPNVSSAPLCASNSAPHQISSVIGDLFAL